jgi:hypothetical protein
MRQFGLFDGSPPPPPSDPLAVLRAQVEAEYGGPSKLFEAFVAFHHANPAVLPLLVRFARAAHQSGHTHYGIGAIWERVRWHLSIDTHDPTGLKLNNNHRAYYARLIALLHPDLTSLFATRQLGQPHHLV